MNDLLFDSFEVSRVLVIAPLRVARETWGEEIRKWDHLRNIRYQIAVGNEAQRLKALNTEADVYIINRENVEWLARNCSLSFDMIVIDELSSFKNHQIKRFKALMKLREKAKRVVGLTGTPCSNGLMDLFAEFKVLDMGQRLGRTITGYRNEFFLPDKRNGQVVYSYKIQPGAEERIYARINDITISMKAKDYLKMPELVMNDYFVTLSAGERKTYDTLKKEMVVSLGDKEIDAVNSATLSGKLLQMASGAVYDDTGQSIDIHSGKLDALEDIVESANGKTVLVAYWFKADKERIQKRFPNAREIKSDKDIHDWNDGKIELALIHPASAGHGLNLQKGGHLLVWFSLTWSLELYEQTNGRLYRQGQTKTTVITHIVAKDTIDEQVIKALKNKSKTQTSMIDAVRKELK